MKKARLKKSVKKTHSKKAHAQPHVHRPHSPFFILWELITLACVFFVAEAFFGHPYIHVDEKTEHILELAVHGAETILIAEVFLLILIARDKIKFIQKNWLTIAAVAPVGGGFRVVTIAKLGWHAFEKTRVGIFFKHPIQYTRRWVRMKMGLPV